MATREGLVLLAHLLPTIHPITHFIPPGDSYLPSNYIQLFIRFHLHQIPFYYLHNSHP